VVLGVDFFVEDLALAFWGSADGTGALASSSGLLLSIGSEILVERPEKMEELSWLSDAAGTTEVGGTFVVKDGIGTPVEGMVVIGVPSTTAHIGALDELVASDDEGIGVPSTTAHIGVLDKLVGVEEERTTEDALSIGVPSTTAHTGVLDKLIVLGGLVEDCAVDCELSLDR
jgi:hypothetical protein